MELESNENDDDDALRDIRGIGMGCVLGIAVFVVLGVAALIWLIVRFV